MKSSMSSWSYNSITEMKTRVIYRKTLMLTMFCSCVLFLLFTTGCSQMYSGFQAVGEESCYKLAYPEQQECLEQISMGYDEYEKEREQSKKM